MVAVNGGPWALAWPWAKSCSQASCQGHAEGRCNLHLKEYTNAELGAMLRVAGFSRVWSPAVPSRVLMRLGPARRYAYVPVAVKGIGEKVLRRLPSSMRDRASRLLGVREVALLAKR